MSKNSPLLRLFWDTALKALGLGKPSLPRLPASEPQLMRLRQTLWRLRHAYQEASGGADPQALADLALGLSSVTREALRALPLWINMIETLAQSAEANLNNGPGRLKAEQVKAGVGYLLSRSHSPAIKALNADPVLLSVLLDLFIDFVVMLLNRHQLWENEQDDDGPSENWLARAWRRLWRWLSRGGRWLLAKGAPLVARLYTWLAPRAVLDPSVRAAADRLLNGMDGDPFAPVSALSSLLQTLAQNRRLVAAIADLISTACSEAENLIQLTGAAKKDYARDLITIFVEQYLGHRLSAPSRNLLAFVADPLIDAVVGIFNKHGQFKSHALAPPPRSEGA